MAYIFLDESGHFDKRTDGKYFVIGSFTVGAPRRTAKAFRSWCKTRLPKKIRYQSEIKFSDHGIINDLRIRTLKFIAKLDIRIHYSYFLRGDIPFDYWKKEKLRSGLLYTNVIGETL